MQGLWPFFPGRLCPGTVTWVVLPHEVAVPPSRIPGWPHLAYEVREQRSRCDFERAHVLVWTTCLDTSFLGVFPGSRAVDCNPG